MQCCFDTVCNHSTCHLLPYSSFILILQLYLPPNYKHHVATTHWISATSLSNKEKRTGGDIRGCFCSSVCGTKWHSDLWPSGTSSNLSAWTSGARSEVPLAPRSGWRRPQSSWEHSVEFNYFHRLHRQMCLFLFRPYYNWTRQHGNISFMEKLRHFHFIVTFNATLQSGPTSSGRALTQTEVSLGSNLDEHSFQNITSNNNNKIICSGKQFCKWTTQIKL